MTTPDDPAADGATAQRGGPGAAPPNEAGPTTPVVKPKRPHTQSGSEAAPAEPKPRKKGKAPAQPEARTPACTTALPAPMPDGTFDLRDPSCYLNRELTWLGFNFRVLHEAEDERTALLERVKFIAIVGSNLDEFFMKRIGGLKQQVEAGFSKPTLDGRTPRQQIEDCLQLIATLEEHQRAVLRQVAQALSAEDITLADYAQLSAQDRKHLREQYIENIYPLVTPQAVDPAHPFPFVSNLSLNLLVTLRYDTGAPAPLVRVKVPVGSGSPRFLRLPERNVFVRLESVMADNLDLLFPGMEVESVSLFRVTRNANTERAEEHADDLLSMIESELRERRLAPIVRLEVMAGMNPVHRGMLAAELGLDEQTDVVEVSGLLGLRDVMEIAGIKSPQLHDAPHHSVDHPALVSDRPIFHILRDAGSILLQHPYQSFSTSVERFLKAASTDPKVRAIKMTLYRTSAESKAIDYLVDAARNGKQVAVVVELKARFDEAANIRWASRLEEAGIHVTYGVVGLKTHCKVILVVRKDYDGLRRYAHIGTGNYHAETARLYSDLGILTADRQIGAELTELFNYLTTGFKPRRNYSKIMPAPKIARRGLMDRIEREIALHTEKGDGLIRIKTNAIEDGEITRALYRASQAGVRVELIVRDSCRLRPGVKGLSENITVISIVGRFLEHTRIYYFRNDGDEEYYIGSADCMKRNLDSRVEVLVAVEAPALRKELRRMLDTQLGDRRSAWEMRADGSYVQRRAPEGKESVGSQEAQIQWAEKGHKEATRLKRRPPRGIRRRNVR